MNYDKHPLSKLDFKNFDEIEELAKKIKKAVEKAFKEDNNGEFSFEFKNKKYKGNINNKNFYMGWIYGMKLK